MTGVPKGWAPYGIRKVKPAGAPPLLAPTLLLLLLKDDERIFCLTKRGALGGWCYRSDWAAMQEFAKWDGETPPPAGEWRDFEKDH